MRVIKKSEVREIIIRHVECLSIFLFDKQNRDFRASFLGQKQELLSMACNRLKLSCI